MTKRWLVWVVFMAGLAILGCVLVLWLYPDSEKPPEIDPPNSLRSSWSLALFRRFRAWLGW